MATTTPQNPGDQAPPATPGTGEAICDNCKGTGKVNGQDCPNCGGTGKVIEGIGGG
jgi:DnaJ-class molecular chaperone